MDWQLRNRLKALLDRALEPEAPQKKAVEPDLFKALTAAAGSLVAISGITYLFGFIIVNGHAIQFGLRSFELSQPTYFMAGLGYLMLFFVPVLAMLMLPVLIRQPVAWWMARREAIKGLLPDVKQDNCWKSFQKYCCEKNSGDAAG